MTENVGYFLEWSARPQEPARETMAKYMNSRMCQATSEISLANHSAHDAGLNRPVKWSTIAHKQSAVSSLRPLRSKILGDCPTSLCRQRKNVNSARLVGSQTNRSSAPIYIRELQLYDFACAQPNIRETARHRAGPLRRTRQLLERPKKLLYLLFGKHFR